MSTSDDEYDQSAASALQEKLYYNGDILDSCLLVISQYKDQSVGYLTSIINFAYVLLRMLEKHSKNNSYMFVRKRKGLSGKKKKGEDDGRPEYDDEDEEAGILEGDKDMPSYAEHQFKFQTFEKVSSIPAAEPCAELMKALRMRSSGAHAHVLPCSLPLFHRT